VSGPHRVIVGTSGSPGSLCALRYAGYLARVTDATVIPVHAWIPPGGDLADRRSPSLYLRRVWAEAAWQRLRDALDAAWGGLQPAGLQVQPIVQRGEPGPVLTRVASNPGDLLVIGAGRRGALARIAGGRVSRYCLVRAQCPVLAIPPPALAQTPHGPLSRAWRHRTLTPERILGGADHTPA
jgi:nucleotide-binding universal stress UspA family protein